MLQLEKAQDLAVAMGEHLAVKEHLMIEPERGFGQLGKGGGGFFEVSREQLDAITGVMQLAADAVVFLFCPHLGCAHALERLLGSLDRACEHEADRLEQRHGRGLELPVAAADGGLADIAGDQMNPLHLRDRHFEGFGDGSLDEALAEADPHLTRDDLDHEPSGFRVDAIQQLLERSGLGAAASGTDLLQGGGERLERDVLAFGAALQGLAGPVAEVRMLAPDLTQLFLRPARQGGHSFVDLPPSEAESLPFRRTEGTPAHEDRGQAEVVIRIQCAEVGAQGARLLQRGRGRGDLRANSRKLNQKSHPGRACVPINKSHPGRACGPQSPIVVSMRRCPYLEELVKDQRMLLRVYRFDCHVDHQSKRKYALTDSPPICVRNFEDCPLYQSEKRREDQTITRYTD